MNSFMHRRLTRRVALVSGLLVLTLCAGTLGFRWIEHYAWFDAFYMTLITISTVGYQELHPLSHAGRVFNSFLIFFGVTIMFLAAGAMTQAIVELELQTPYGNRRRRTMIRELQDHYIVCGFGRVGRNAALEFQRSKVAFVVLDRSEPRVAGAAASGILAVAADATRDEALREAGVLRARGLVAALPSDAENLFVILSAKALNPRLNVATRASEEEAEQKLRRAGADIVFAPYTVAGRQLAHAMLRPHVLEFLEFSRTSIGPRIATEQILVAPAAAQAATLGGLLGPDDSGVIVLALRQAGGNTIFHPPADQPIAEGDHLIVMGERENLITLEHRVIGS
jgi:voltage-gated potassium channel